MIDHSHSQNRAARQRAGCFPVLFLLAAWPALVAPLRADNPPTYWSKILGYGVSGGFTPFFVALDNSNNVYVTVGFGVDKFDSNGNYLTQWGSWGTNNGQFVGGVSGIAVDSSNNVYVVDRNNYRIQKFDSIGNYLMQWGSLGTNNGQFGEPVGVAVDASNNVYVTDLSYARVDKFDSNGNFLMQWGGFGTNNGQFEYPEGIAVDSSNNVYVSDIGNSRIGKFDNNGAYLTQWGSYGANNGQFEYPEGVAVDSSNHVYVVDLSNSRIEKFDGNGNYLTQWGSGGTGTGQFEFGYGPSGIAVNSKGNFIYVADHDNYRVQVFVNNTNILPPIITNQPMSQAAALGTNVTFSVSVIGGAPFAYQWISNNVAVPGATNTTLTLTHISFAASGAYSVLVTNAFGSELSSNAVLTVLPAAEFVTPTYLFQIDSSAVPGGFEPRFVALDSSNNLYVTDYNNSRVVKFDSGGNYLIQWGGFGTDNGQFEYPEGIAVDASNNVYVVDTTRVEKFDSNGNYLTQWGSYGTNNGQFESPEGIAVDAGNNVYVTDPGNNRVEKLNNNGNYLTQWGTNGSGNGQFTGPYGIAVDASNRVCVVDNGNSRIEKFDSNGNYLSQWGNFGFGNGQLYYPAGVAADSNNVYVVDQGNYRVEKFDGNGNYLTQWGGYGTSNGKFIYPIGIAVDRRGNFIYVADYSNSRIQVFVNNTSIIAPFIMQQPAANQVVVVGANVTFSVGLTSTAPSAFQWISNNIAVPGATNATFTLTHVSLSASGVYSVLVTNNFGSELSSNAVLAVVPALVTTQPAYGESATGTVLDGTVYVGVESLAWFEWGTDTNYGNITGATVVPGNNGSTNISAPLNGLPGNFYHYRMDAANDFGIVYGQDQLFTVGLPPSATTLPPTNGANGATLNAIVNPEGWKTTVYFQWQTPTLTNTTAGIDIGAGVTSVSVSNFVPGLASFPPYQYRVMASNALGTVFGAVAYGDPDQHRYLFSGSKTNITLNPGTYIITAYGAAGGFAASFYGYAVPGRGAEMSAEFNFLTSTTLTLLVGGAGGTANHHPVTNFYGGGGGGGSFVVQGTTPLVIAGGGGGGAASGSTSPVTVAGGNASTNTDGNGGSGVSYGGFNNLFGPFPAGGAGGTYGNGGAGGGDGGVLRDGGGGGGGGGFSGDGGYGYGSGGGAGGSSFIDGGGGGVASYNGGDYRGNYNGGFGGGGAGYGNLGNSNFEFGFGGGGGGYGGGGGGGGISGSGDGFSAHVQTVGSGGGGGSIINSSAIAILAEVLGIQSPDGGYNGEIIITPVPPPPPLAITTGASFGFTNGAFGFNVTGPAGSNVVIQASTDLHTWIPLQTNLLGSAPLYFSDAQSPANTRRFYRLQLSP